jgi:hypothetical protein
MNRIFNTLRTEIGRFLESSTKLLNHMYGLDDDDDINIDIDIGDANLEKKNPTVSFENKYLARYKQLTATTNVPSNTSFVIEMSPIGNVVMMYDVSKESFVYYSDHIVPFRLLETIAMKYVCFFDCKQIYVDRHKEIIQIVATQPKTTKDIFNQVRNPTANTKKEQIEVKMNRYRNAGRFSNFIVLQPVANHITDKKRLMKFSDFKKQQISC